MAKQIQIKYQEYPECMFAMIDAYEGHEVRLAAGKVVFRHTDEYGNTYKNGVLHSYDDKPAVDRGKVKEWYKDGNLKSNVSKQN